MASSATPPSPPSGLRQRGGKYSTLSSDSTSWSSDDDNSGDRRIPSGGKTFVDGVKTRDEKK